MTFNFSALAHGQSLRGAPENVLAAPGDPLIRFEGISKRFNTADGEILAVSDINLNIAHGEFVTLVGPSGCGKSTLLNMISGLFGPSSGQVFYDNKPVKGFNLSVGYMTQNDHLLPWRTVFGNIAVPLEIRGLGKAAIRDKIEPLLEMVGLSAFRNSYPSQLSGGMRKRAALARLLAYDPDTLLMDEPFAALDAQLRLNMQSELLDICRRFNKTVVFVTHDLDEAVALGDRIAVFTPRPGTIATIISSPLDRHRDLSRLRHNPDFVQLTASLWDMIIPPPAATKGGRS